MAATTRLLRELGRRSGRSRNLEFLSPTPFTALSNSSGKQFDSRPLSDHLSAARHPSLKNVTSKPFFDQSLAPTIAFAVGAPSCAHHRFLGRDLVLLGKPGLSEISRVGWDSAPGRSVAAFSRSAPPSKPPTSAGESSNADPERPDAKKKTEEKSLGSRIKDLFLALEAVPAAPLGLGLGGAIPFVSLTPGIASLLPMPDILFANHSGAQAAYGAVILTFLGGPHWGLAMAGNDGSQSSKFAKLSIQTIRYVWSVIPSLVAWPALLLNPVPKFAVLITSFLVVLGVDATFARHGLLPSWYMPMRYLLTGIATLSMTSSLIVTAAESVVHHSHD